MQAPLHPCRQGNVDGSPMAEDISLLVQISWSKTCWAPAPALPGFQILSPVHWLLSLTGIIMLSDLHFSSISFPMAHPPEASLACSRSFHSIWPPTDLSSLLIISYFPCSNHHWDDLAHLFPYILSVPLPHFNKLRLFCITQYNIQYQNLILLNVWINDCTEENENPRSRTLAS